MIFSIVLYGVIKISQYAYKKYIQTNYAYPNCKTCSKCKAQNSNIICRTCNYFSVCSQCYCKNQYKCHNCQSVSYNQIKLLNWSRRQDVRLRLADLQSAALLSLLRQHMIPGLGRRARTSTLQLRRLLHFLLCYT